MILQPSEADPKQPRPQADALPSGSNQPVTVDFRHLSQLIPQDAIEPVYFPKSISAQESHIGDGALVIGLSITRKIKPIQWVRSIMGKWLTTWWEGCRFWLPGDPFAIPVWLTTGKLATALHLRQSGRTVPAGDDLVGSRNPERLVPALGQAFRGPLENTSLYLIPASIVPWGVWREQHPDTRVLNLEDCPYNDLVHPFDPNNPNYVIGIALGPEARAFPFQATSVQGVVSDRVGQFPVVVTADPDRRPVHNYSRRVGAEELDLELQEGKLQDRQTGSTWDLDRGIAEVGPLRGAVLQRVPYITAYNWAWEDFSPHSTYDPGPD